MVGCWLIDSLWAHLINGMEVSIVQFSRDQADEEIVIKLKF